LLGIRAVKLNGIPDDNRKLLSVIPAHTSHTGVIPGSGDMTGTGRARYPPKSLCGIYWILLVRSVSSTVHDIKIDFEAVPHFPESRL